MVGRRHRHQRPAINASADLAHTLLLCSGCSADRRLEGGALSARRVIVDGALPRPLGALLADRSLALDLVQVVAGDAQALRLGRRTLAHSVGQSLTLAAARLKVTSRLTVRALLARHTRCAAPELAGVAPRHALIVPRSVSAGN